MEEANHIITAAGGNGTVIQVVPGLHNRRWYSVEGRELLRQYREKGAEQAGFLNVEESHFNMSGGEFCGNAARSAILLLSLLNNTKEVDLSMSGCPNRIKGKVLEKLDNKRYRVSCTFWGLPMDISETKILRKTPATIVDLKSMIHIIIDAPFPENDFEAQHRQIMEQLDLKRRYAVSVVWIDRHSSDLVDIDSVVWVRDVDSLFHDQSCGSGSIAVAKITGATQIKQATGQIITVQTADEEITLESEMEITFGNVPVLS